MNNRSDYTNPTVFKNSLGTLEALLEKLFNFLKDRTPVSIRHADYIPSYDFVFYASSQDDKISERLYDYFKNTTINYASALKDSMSLLRENQVDLLEEFVQAWENIKIYLRWMMKIFSNLDKHHLQLLDLTICYTGFKLFKEHCFVSQVPRVVTLILNLLNKQREGEEVPSLLIIRALKNIYQLGGGKNTNLQINTEKNDYSRLYFTGTVDPNYYKEEFEKKLLDSTRSFYEARSHEWLTWSVPEYVRTALLKLKEEEDRAEKFYPSSLKVVIAVIEDTIIVKHHKALASNENTGVNAMFAKGSKEELAHCFALFKRAQETLIEIINRFGSFVEAQGVSIISDPNVTKDPIEFARKLIELKIESDSFVQKQFQSNLSFQRKRDMVFQIILNKFEKSPGYLASYLDYEFKKGMKGNTEDEIEQKLNNAKSLIFLLNSRDAFLKIYAKQLSSRLLNSTTVSNEAEKSMYNLMQAEWGQMTVTKIKSMLQDIEISKEMNGEFQKFLITQKTKLTFDMSISILTQGCWPENEAKKSRIPEEVEPCKVAFEKFYHMKYPGKILSWTLNLGDCEMVGVFEKRKYLLILSNVQMSILLLFNKRNEMKYEEIKTLLGLSDADLEPNILFLCTKNEILTKANAQIKEKVYEDELLTFNNAYTSSLKRVNCKPTRIAVAKKLEEASNAEKDVIKEREFIIDATVIRIMKSRRILDYNSIQTETKKLITMFVPDPAMIKRRIESLCEREYMKRDENDKTKFIYMP